MRCICPPALILTALLSGSALAQEMRLGSGVSDVMGAAELDLVFDAQDSMEIASGRVILRFDPEFISLQERCRSAVGGSLFSSHRVSCSVDNEAGAAVISFQSLVSDIPQVLTGQWNFGVFEARLLVSGSDSWHQVMRESVEFRNSDQELVYWAIDQLPAGRAFFVAGWPEDVYESGNDPRLASSIGRFSFIDRNARLLPVRARDYQVRSLSQANDEDWVIIESTSTIFAPELLVLALSAQLPADFQPIVEIYTIGRLFDPDEDPVQTIGDCQGSARELSEFSNELSRNRLLRITNCVAPSSDGLPYELGLEFGRTQVSGEAAASGKVMDESNGQPVQTVIFSDSNQIAVSSPLDGAYRIDLPAGEQTGLRIVSDRYAPVEIMIPPLKEGELSENNNITTFRIPNEVFDDGFEAP